LDAIEDVGVEGVVVLGFVEIIFDVGAGTGAGDGDVGRQFCPAADISSANVAFTDCSQVTQSEISVAPAAIKTLQPQTVSVSEQELSPLSQEQDVLKHGSVAGTGEPPLTHLEVDWEQTKGYLQQFIPQTSSPDPVQGVTGTGFIQAVLVQVVPLGQHPPPKDAAQAKYPALHVCVALPKRPEISVPRLRRTPEYC
jgi:hypothetical protein